jgi:hypothetical protein
MQVQDIERVNPVFTNPVKWTLTPEPITASAEEHMWDIAYNSTMASGSGAVAHNIVHTTGGSAGAWACGIYAKVVQATSKKVNGYLNAAEFETTISGSYNCSDYCVLALNSTFTNTGGAVSHPAFIYFRDYGTADKTNLLFWIADNTIATTDGTKLVTTSAGKTHSHSIGIQVGATKLWLMCTSTTG